MGADNPGIAPQTTAAYPPIVKARKQHRCALCPWPIEVGVEHISERVTPWAHPDNEHFWQFRGHLHCERIYRDVCAEWGWEDVACDESIWGEWWNDRHPHDCPGQAEYAEGLVFCAGCGFGVDLNSRPARVRLPGMAAWPALTGPYLPDGETNV